MRLPQLFPAAVAVVVAAVAGMILSTATVQAAPKTPLQRPVEAYAAELGRQCPMRGLRDMIPGDLDPIMEGFVERLTPAQRRTVQDAVGYRCARIEAGLTCANTASLTVFRRLGVLPAFVKEACASGWTCHGLGGCMQAAP